MADYQRLIENTRQGRAALVDYRARPSSGSTADQRIGLAHRVGDRVFDTVTGEHGEVIGGEVNNVVVPIAAR